jgi:hypothetical protein
MQLVLRNDGHEHSLRDPETHRKVCALTGPEAAKRGRRIAACVNALDGVPTEQLESLEPGDLAGGIFYRLLREVAEHSPDAILVDVANALAPPPA